MEHLEHADVEALAKVRALRPKTADVLDEFRGSIKDEPDGRHFKADLKTREDVLKMREMGRPYRQAATALSNEWSARQAKLRLRSPRGEVVEVAAHSERVAAKQGFLPASTWSSVRKFAAAPRHYFPCGHYTETAGETVCYWCAEEQ